MCHKDIMREKRDNIQEDVADSLHNAEFDISDQNSTDYKASKRIYDRRKMVAKIGQLHSPEEAWQRLNIRNKNNWLKAAIRYAAIVVLCLLTGAIGNQLMMKETEAETQFTTFTSPKGQISSLTLFDGTHIVLNSQSSVTYSNKYNNKERFIELSGEAFFDVAKNKALPFKLVAEGSEVTVLGTQFNVKAYPNDTYTETVLVEGKVAFKHGVKNDFLKPNQMIQVDRRTGTLLKREVNAKVYTSWMKGKTYFNDQKLEDVLTCLERWFEVEIIYEQDKTREYRFTGFVDKTKSLRYNLFLIKQTNKIDYIQNENQIIIMKK
ncbi:FecR family protein [Prolixibacteraceae bacterium JC049]|nr:FecR family protein [Prolixibacteraceae bacterium JC049]